MKGPGAPGTDQKAHISFGHLFRGLIVACILCLLASGCARKIVKPEAGQPAWAPSYAGGQVLDQELQAVQANLKVIYFDYDKFTLSPEAQSALQYNAEILKRSPQVSLVSEGHCDERGTSEYNLALGDRRARSAVEFLVSLGIPANRFSTVSYGSEIPVDPGHNEAAWSKNRRVYLRVSK